MAFDPRLARDLGFEETDLEANRAGRLSDRQRHLIAAGADTIRRATPRTGLVVTAGVAIGVIGLGWQRISDLDAWYKVAGGLLMAALGIMATMGRRPQEMIDLSRSDVQVRSVEGPMAINRNATWYAPRYGRRWRVTVGGVGFHLNPHHGRYLVEANTYRCYFYEATVPVLLSVEPT